MNVGQMVTFDQGDEQHTMLTGFISRVWSDGRTYTIKTPGAIAGSFKTFVRYGDQVTPAAPCRQTDACCCAECMGR